MANSSLSGVISAGYLQSCRVTSHQNEIFQFIKSLNYNERAHVFNMQAVLMKEVYSLSVSNNINFNEMKIQTVAE